MEHRKPKRWLALLVLICMTIIPALYHTDDPIPSATGAPVLLNMNKNVVIPKVNSLPVSNNKLDAAVLNRMAVISDFHMIGSPNETQAQIITYLAYDEHDLHVIASVPEERAATLSQMEVIIGTGLPEEPHYVASIAFETNTRPILTDWNPGLDLSSENPNRHLLRGGVSRQIDRQETEAIWLHSAIPLGSFAEEISPGDEWKLNIVFIHNVNTMPIVSWIPLTTARYWDTGGQVGLTANMVDHGRMGSLFFAESPWDISTTPGHWDLRYIDFTEKQLNFEWLNETQSQIELLWKSPIHDWKSIDSVKQTDHNTSHSISFVHPKPLEDGIYQLRVVAKTGEERSKLLSTLLFDREDLIRAGVAMFDQVEQSAPQDIVNVDPKPASPYIQNLIDLIPEKTGFRFVGLPERPELYPDSLYRLSTDGRNIVAAKTFTAYPNERYRETKTITAINQKGEPVAYPYYEDESGKRYFISAHLWYLQKEHIFQEISKITTMPLLKDQLGVARILHRFAQVYEGYVPTTDYPGYTAPLHYHSGPPFNYWGGMLNRWSVAELFSLRYLLNAFTAVKKTNAFEVLSAEVGVNVENMVLEKMIIPSLDFALRYPITLGNMDYANWLGLIEAGKALNNPDYIHRAVEWIHLFLEKQFLSDGSWREVSPSYHVQSFDGVLQAAAELQGWTDPEGYISPRTGVRFDNANLLGNKPFIAKAAEFQRKLTYPNGKLLPAQDTWANETIMEPWIDSGPLLFPAAKIAKMQIGEGPGQTNVFLQFTPKYGHDHYDPLNLTLFSHGQELLPDLGYTYTDFRYFTVSTIGHNTVIVDSSDMDMNSQSKHGGNVELFADAETLAQVIRVDQKQAYPQTRRYSREPWLIPFHGEETEAYIVDIFRVAGGERHEYTLQGDANYEAIFHVDLPLAAYGDHLLQHAGGTAASGDYPGYTYVQHVQKADLPKDQFHLTLATSMFDAEQASLAMTVLLDEGKNELFLGRSPSIRSTRLQGTAGDTNDLAVQYDMPKMVLRRDGNNLESTFITVMEPLKPSQTSRVTSINKLPIDQGPEGAIALQITYGNTTDIILSTYGNNGLPLMTGDITLVGDAALIRIVDDEIKEAVLLSGTELHIGQLKLLGSGPVQGKVTRTLRKAQGDPYNAIMTDAEVPPEFQDHYMIITHPDHSTSGYHIAEVINQNEQTIIILSEYDPGFEVNEDGSSQMIYYPRKTWDGAHLFQIGNIEVFRDFTDK